LAHALLNAARAVIETPRKHKINRSALFAFWYRIDRQSLLGLGSVKYWGS
jgi:hypothetical protein